MQLTKEQRAANAAIREERIALNKAENRPRRHRTKLAQAFLKALPTANGRWIRRVSDSMRRVGFAA